MLMIIMIRNPSLSADNTWTETYWPLHTPMKREVNIIIVVVVVVVVVIVVTKPNMCFQVMHLNAHKSEVLEGLRVKKCAFWRKFLPQLGKTFLAGSSIPNLGGQSVSQSRMRSEVVG